MSAIPTMTDHEVRSCRLPDEEPGFGALATQKGNLPLEAVDVQATITGLVSEVRLSQTFVNGFAEPLEATYIFPMPDRAAVTKFVMTVNGREIVGILKERGEARRDYDVAIQAGHRAAIAEEERPNTFTMRVGNLLPGEKATIHLVMTSPLPYQDGEATFRFPLVVAPRYIPGAPLGGVPVGDGVSPDTDAVPDASRITAPVLLPGFPNPVKLGITVDVDAAGLPFRGMKSSLHAISAQPKGTNTRVSIQPGERLDRDFILRLALGEDAIRTSLSLKADDAKEQAAGTFVLTLVPPVDVSKAAKPRDVVFVLDHSGSMGGWKMVASRRAVARMVDTLGDKDRFTVYAFDDSIDTVPEFAGTGLVPATDRNRFRAVEFLARVEADGGTEMAAPLDLAAKQLQGHDRERQRILVLVTDGQVGNEDQILRMLGPQIGGMRIFTVGIDSAVNDGFLKRLAGIGGGSCELVEGEDRLDEVMDKIHRRIGTPVLTEVKIEAAGLTIEGGTVTPTRMPALFAGAPLVIAGRFKGKPSGGVIVTGVDAAGRPWSETVTPGHSPNPAVATVWARAHLRDLEDQYVIRADAKLEKRIVDTSLFFGVLCRFTAFVAVDASEVVNKGGKNRRMTQPVDAPAGWDMFGAEQEEMKELSRAASPTTATADKSVMTPRAQGQSGGGNASRASAPPPPPMEAVDALLDDSASAAPEPAKRASPLGGLFKSKKKAPVASRAAPSPKSTASGSRSSMRFDEMERKAESVAGLDLGPYRERAREILALLESTDASVHLLRLGEAAVKLAALVEDLKSVSTPANEVKPLEELLATLKKGLAKTHLDAAEAAALVETSVKTLTAFSKGGSGTAPAPNPSQPRREGFWK